MKDEACESHLSALKFQIGQHEGIRLNLTSDPFANEVLHDRDQCLDIFYSAIQPLNIH